MIKKISLALSLIFCLLIAWPTRAESSVKAYVFTMEGCPHCAAAKEFFNDLQTREPYADNFSWREFEVVSSRDNSKLFQAVAKRLQFATTGVPVIVIGEKYFVGFDSLEGRGATIKGEIDRQLQYDKPIDIVTGLMKEPNKVETKSKTAGDFTFKLPFLGLKDLGQYSLPVLAVVVGLVDGFNPCAMWALLFLISLLLGMKDRRRMWLLGSVFIFVSALVYFIFMAAWLNLILFMGQILFLRTLIALVAIGGGAWNLRKFYKSRGDGACEIVNTDDKRAFFTKLKETVLKEKFYLALVGIIALAASVNLVEMLCSAGLPAIFTQILTLNNLPLWQYYGYIALYILFYMLDDLIIFFIAMLTLRATAISTRYGRWSSLIGGLLMLIIGLLLIIKPGWLMFG